MKLFSFLFGITLFSGVMRFSGISLLDEAAFLVLLCLLILFKKKNARAGPSPYINKYYSRAKASYLFLFSYLILSLFHGFLIDPYIGKLRWLVILAALLVCDNYFSFYLRSKINDANRITHIKRIYNLLLFFIIFYFLYAVLARVLFGISPDLIQDAQTDAWYAIWATTAYTASIFLPLLLFNKLLKINKNVSNIKYFSIYLLAIFFVVFFDSRIMIVILFMFFFAAVYKMRPLTTLTVFSVISIAVVVVGAQILASGFMGNLSTSGGFLIYLASDGASGNVSGDFDRVAHYIATYQILSESISTALFGSGFLNAGTTIIDAYLDIYHQYGIMTGNLVENIAGKTQISTFGLSAFLIENGLIGGLLLLIHLYNLCMFSIKTKLLVPSIYVVIVYSLLIFILFSIYLNDNMLFYLMLSPSIFIYPLIDNKNTAQDR